MAPVTDWLGEDDVAAANRRTASLAGLAMTLLIVVVSLYLARVLHHQAMMQDCLLSGRMGCDVVVAAVE